MNRNVMYHSLKDSDLVYRVIRRKKGYHIIFRYENWNSFAVDLGAIYVRGVCEIALCKDEIVLMSKYENMKVNVNYKSIENVEIMDEY